MHKTNLVPVVSRFSSFKKWLNMLNLQYLLRVMYLDPFIVQATYSPNTHFFLDLLRRIFLCHLTHQFDSMCEIFLSN